MKNRSVRQRILVTLAVVLALMVVMGAVALTKLARIEQEATHLHRDSLPGLYYSTQILVVRIVDYSLTQQHVLSGDRIAKQKLADRLEANRVQIESLIAAYEATLTTPEDRALFEVFQNTRAPYRAIQEQVLRASVGSDSARRGDVLDPQTNPEAVGRISLDLEPEFVKSQGVIQSIVEANKKVADDATARILSAVAAAKFGILASIVVALLLAFLCGYYLLKAITRPLTQLVGVLDVMRTGDFTQRVIVDRHDEFGALADGFNRMTEELTGLVGQVLRSGIEVDSSVSAIASTARQQQATASEIATTTTEIGATSREISATSKELVRTMSEVSAVAERSATLAGSGQAGLTQMEETMRHVMEASGSVNAKLAVLNERAGNISQVVTTITKVADQTNLLSLNAAIEAEKAGEYGRGFAVVATEVRRLADQTAVATFDIEQMVKEIQSAVSAGVIGMDTFSEEVRRGMHEVQQVGVQLSQIIEQVQALVPRFETVNEGMQAQTTGAEQISEGLAQLSETARQTVESLRQSNQAIDELNQVASGLRSGVSRFRLQA